MATTAPGWTVKANMDAFNISLEAYGKKFLREQGTIIKWAATETVSRIEKSCPVDTGRYRAGWLPFLWSNKISAALNARGGGGGHKGRIARQEGVRACKFKTKAGIREVKPYAEVTNNVRYGPYLEYGVRPKAQHGTAFRSGQRTFSVSKRMGKGHVKRAIQDVHRGIKAKLKRGA
jgi:hypothetical protein